MNSAIFAENFIRSKENEYIGFAEKLGADVRFSADRWVVTGSAALRPRKIEQNSIYIENRVPYN